MKVFLVAGEPSGDALGGALLKGLRTAQPLLHLRGIGGPEMQAQGLSSLFPMDELSVMGLAEVLPKYRHLKRRIAQTAQAVLDFKPDVLITIDSPDFSLRVAKIVKAASNIRTVHYVAPTVWAWRPKRAEKMARMVDHVLALFPFEPPLMEAAGMACDFVGHPVVATPVVAEDVTRAFRAKHSISQNARLILLLPGSRKGEVSRLAPVIGDTLKRIKEDHPGASYILPAAAPVLSLVQDQIAEWPIKPLVLDPTGWDADGFQMEKRTAFAAADIALAASGTVALELAAAQTPMVSIYNFHWLSWMILSRMALTDTVNLVNLVSETRTVPEFLGPDCLPDKIAAGFDALSRDPDAQAEAMEMTMKRLGQGGADPGQRAAEAVLNRM